MQRRELVREARIAEFGSYEAYVEAKRQKRLDRYRRTFATYAARNPDKVRAKNERRHRLRQAESDAQRRSRLAATGGSSMVYFVRNGDAPDAEIKIGYTEQGGLRGRLKSLQCGNPRRLCVIGVIRGGTFQDERDLHERFAFSVIREAGSATEWFRPHADLVAYIAERATPWTESDEAAA